MDRRAFLRGLLATSVLPALPPPVITGAFETTVFNAHLMRSALWSRQIKEMLLDDLNSMKFTAIMKD